MDEGVEGGRASKVKVRDVEDEVEKNRHISKQSQEKVTAEKTALRRQLRALWVR